MEAHAVADKIRRKYTISTATTEGMALLYSVCIIMDVSMQWFENYAPWVKLWVIGGAHYCAINVLAPFLAPSHPLQKAEQGAGKEAMI